MYIIIIIIIQQDIPPPKGQQITCHEKNSKEAGLQQKIISSLYPLVAGLVKEKPPTHKSFM